MKIGEWDTAGEAGAIMQVQLVELRATELATHVALGENGRLRILMATDIGLLDYRYHPAGADPDGPWSLRGELYRWTSVRGLRLQTEGQVQTGEAHDARWICRFVGEEPKIDLEAESTGSGERSHVAVLQLARACLEHAG
jgi:hypothetical protein